MLSVCVAQKCYKKETWKEPGKFGGILSNGNKLSRDMHLHRGKKQEKSHE